MGIGGELSRLLPALSIKYLFDALDKTYQLFFIMITMLKMLSSDFYKILSLHHVFSTMVQEFKKRQNYLITDV